MYGRLLRVVHIPVVLTPCFRSPAPLGDQPSQDRTPHGEHHCRATCYTASATHSRIKEYLGKVSPSVLMARLTTMNMFDWHRQRRYHDSFPCALHVPRCVIIKSLPLTPHICDASSDVSPTCKTTKEIDGFGRR